MARLGAALAGDGGRGRQGGGGYREWSRVPTAVVFIGRVARVPEVPSILDVHARAETRGAH